MKDSCPLLTEFDQLTLGNSTQMLKAILPFFDYNTQKTLSMIIRLKELISTIEFYKNVTCISSFSNTQLNSPVDLFKAIKAFCPSNGISPETLKMFSQFMQSNSTKTTPEASFMESILNESQMNTYNEYMKAFDKMNF